MFAKGSCYSNNIRCACVVRIGMIIGLLIMMFDLTDFADVIKTVKIVPCFPIDADIP